MLLTLLAFSCCLFVARAHFFEKVCYGGTYTFPSQLYERLNTGDLVFRPSVGGTRQLLIKKGEVMVTDPRFTYSDRTLSVRDVTKRDEGFYMVSFMAVNLKVTDCAVEVDREYSTRFQRSPVDFEYVEFSPYGKQEEINLVWNRSNPDVGGGRTRANRKFWEMDAVTSLDNGFYNFRRQDNSLVKRVRLYVTGHRSYSTVIEGEKFVMNYPGFKMSDSFWTVSFRRNLKQSLMKDGKWIRQENNDNYEHDFIGRFEADENSLTINPVTMEDQGTFEFKDKKDFLILSVEVSVKEAPTPAYHYVLGLAAFLAPMFLCCCCVAKCCSEEDASKTEDAAQDAAATDVQNRDASTSPSHSYSASPAGASSYQPVPLISSTGQDPSQQPPAYDSLDIQPIGPTSASQHKIPVPPSYQPVSSEGIPSEAPPSYDTAVTDETPPHSASEFPHPVPTSLMASNFISSDAEPRFELGRTTLPSAPPLESDSAFSNVYNSDKLNFP